MTPELPSQRRRRVQLAAQEQAIGIIWLDVIDGRARRLIHASFERHYRRGPSVWLSDEVDRAIADAVHLHAELSLSASTWGDTTRDDSETDGVSSEEFLDWLQAAADELARRAVDDGRPAEDGDYTWTMRFDADGFRREVNDIFLERRINFVFVGDRIGERGAEPLHSLIVEPVTALLTSDERFAAAERAYGEAISHLASHQAGATITAAGSALGEALRALGASGQNLGALFMDARRRGFLMGHDRNLFDAYKKVSDWVTADRSNRGNAHWATSADAADARLALQICGALILRIVSIAGAQEPEMPTSSEGPL